MTRRSFFERNAAAIATAIAPQLPASVQAQRDKIDAQAYADRQQREDARRCWCEHCPVKGHCCVCGNNH